MLAALPEASRLGGFPHEAALPGEQSMMSSHPTREGIVSPEKPISKLGKDWRPNRPNTNKQYLYQSWKPRQISTHSRFAANAQASPAPIQRPGREHPGDPQQAPVLQGLLPLVAQQMLPAFAQAIGRSPSAKCEALPKEEKRQRQRRERRQRLNDQFPTSKPVESAGTTSHQNHGQWNISNHQFNKMAWEGCTGTL